MWGLNVPRVKRFVLWGVLIGLAIGVAEALITAAGDPNYWRRVTIHWAQFGCVSWFLGGLLGYVTAKRFERAELRGAARVAQGLCPQCGYNLTGNVSGRCPECGRAHCTDS